MVPPGAAKLAPQFMPLAKAEGLLKDLDLLGLAE